MPARFMANSELSAQSQGLFAAYDSGDTVRTVALLSEDCTVTFGNNPSISGRANVKAALDGLASMVKKTTHAFLHEWVAGADTIVEYVVTYERLNGMSISVPGSTIWTSDGAGLVKDYRVYIDQTPLFAE